MQKARKGLGRGLSALIPDADMSFLTRVARGDAPDVLSAQISAPPIKAATKPVPAKRREALQTKHSGEVEAPEVPHTQHIETQEQTGPTSVVRASQNSLISLSEMVPLSQIEANPYQPRHRFSEEEMQELAASIKQHGVLQPILLRPLPSSDKSSISKEGSAEGIQYQLIAGERRWRAAQRSGLSVIPAIIRRVTDQQALELAVIENVQRHDISAMDAAAAYERLANEFSLAHEEIAQRVGKSRAAISNTIRLLDLPEAVKIAISDGTLSEGHGRAILLAEGDGARRAVFRRVLRDKLSVRATEELARVLQTTKGSLVSDETASQKATPAPPEIRRIEEGLQKHLGTRVNLRPRKRGGQLVIQYFSHEELERVLKVILR